MGGLFSGLFDDVNDADNGRRGGYSKVVRGPGGMTFVYSSGGGGFGGDFFGRPR